MASLLLQISSGNEGSNVVSVQDTIQHSGRCLLKCFLNELSQRVDEVHLFACDHSPEAALAGISPEVRHKVICHDGWSDPQGWNQNGTSPRKHNIVRFTSHKDLLDSVRDTRCGESKTVAVIIDSLTPHIIHRSAPVTCRTIHSLTHPSQNLDFEVSQVVSLIHSDVHDESILRAVNHVSSTVITVSPSVSQTSDGGLMGVCDIMHKRPSGKVLRKQEGYGIDSDFHLTTFQDLPKPMEDMQDDQQPDPTANLTFNLTLTDSEKRARENVVLPFTQVSNSSNQGSGKIFYEPDQADDYDDEDPDDDLDI